MIIRAKGKVKWFEDSLWNQEVQELLKDYKFEMEFEYTQDDKKTIN